MGDCTRAIKCSINMFGCLKNDISMSPHMQKVSKSNSSDISYLGVAPNVLEL